ncbi:hypothetical protein G7046_g4541 [Stylonectria norvegica]|nr:hypothetical protein G7046_g4541 [Stylonectria norvegica]
MLLFKLLLSLSSIISFAFADTNPQDAYLDLGTVLSNHKNLTIYYKLLQKYPDILLQLPSYNGVTIIAPTDHAFRRINYTSLHHIWDPNNHEVTVPLLQYHILQGTVATNAIIPGPSLVKPTLLHNSNYTNVTSGQNILVSKQPDNSVVFTTSMGTRCALVEADIQFQGGLIQVVDNLLLPPARLRETAQSFNVTSFLGGLYASKLLPKVANAQNVTIFAPKNEFVKLVGGNFKNMTSQQLSRLMSYHVVPNQVLVSSDLKNGTWLETMAMDASGSKPEPILVRQDGNFVYINSAQMLQSDILIANGIMHIISNVLSPEAVAAVPNPKLFTQAPVFAVTSVKQIPWTSAIPCTISCPVHTRNITYHNATAEATAEPTETFEPTTSVHSKSSHGGAVAAMATGAHFAGAALGMMGVGAGMVWL